MHFSTRPRKILYVVRSLEVELIRIWLYTYVYGQECCEGELQDRGESALAVVGPMTPQLEAVCKRSLHIVKADGTVIRAGRATLFILEHLGWGLWARLLAVPPFIWLVELGYWIVAKNRPIFAKFLFRRE